MASIVTLTFHLDSFSFTSNDAENVLVMIYRQLCVDYCRNNRRRVYVARYFNLTTSENNSIESFRQHPRAHIKDT